MKPSGFVAAAALLAALAPALADTTIVILRHGEKPAQGLGQVDCQGLNRALALAPLLPTRYGAPTALYAPNPAQKKQDKGIAYAYLRPLATIEPLAVRSGLPVNIDWGMTEVQPLAAHLLTAPAGTYYVAWEHHLAAVLARHLVAGAGGDPATVPPWDNGDFDSLYVVRTTDDGKGGRGVTFSHERQGLDGMPRECPAGPLPAR